MRGYFSPSVLNDSLEKFSMAAKPLIRLSQSYLQTLEICPRKFQYTYLEQLSPPPNPLEQEGLTWGSNFHLIMQQRELGLPVEPLIATDVEMEKAIAALLTTAPELFQPQVQSWRSAEYPLTWEFQGYLFTVIYDLFLAAPATAQIIDWKTYNKPKDAQFLAQQWQTKLYLYILAEAGGYAPEQITMTYWFVKNNPPQKVTITYSQEFHQQTQQELADLLEDLHTYLEQYQSQGQDFSQVSPSAGFCVGCSFAARCDRMEGEITKEGWGDRQNFMPSDLGTIPEIAI